MSIPKTVTTKELTFLKAWKKLHAELGKGPRYVALQDELDYPYPNSIRQFYKSLERKGYFKQVAGEWMLSENGRMYCPTCGCKTNHAGEYESINT